jgi:hypothetical protein
MVRPVGTAPTSPAWKAEILLLNDGRLFEKWPLELELRQPLELFRPALICLSHPAKNGACDECCPRFMFRSTGGCPCCWTSHAKWPARVSRPVLSLKRRLHHCNACGPLVLQYGAAPSSAGYQPAALLLSYRRIKTWWPARDLRSARSVKSRLLRCQSLQAVGIRDRCSPGYLRLERATSLVVPPHGHNWQPRPDLHRLARD